VQHRSLEEVFLVEHTVELLVQGLRELPDDGDVLRFVCGPLKQLLAEFKQQFLVLLELENVIQGVFLVVAGQFVKRKADLLGLCGMVDLVNHRHFQAVVGRVFVFKALLFAEAVFLFVLGALMSMSI